MKQDYPPVLLRAKAAIIDVIIMIVMMLAVSDIFSNMENVPNYYKMIAFVGIYLLYDPLFISLKGATIGHQICKIKVQRLDNGKNINLIQAIIRFVMKSILGIVSFFTVSQNQNGQAIHDGVVNSVVVFDN